MCLSPCVHELMSPRVHVWMYTHEGDCMSPHGTCVCHSIMQATSHSLNLTSQCGALVVRQDYSPAELYNVTILNCRPADQVNYTMSLLSTADEGNYTMSLFSTADQQTRVIIQCQYSQLQTRVIIQCHYAQLQTSRRG